MQQQALPALVAEQLTEQLQRVGFAGFVLEPEKVARHLLGAIADRLRQEIGPDDCGCGGCDACAQHALVDLLAPR